MKQIRTRLNILSATYGPAEGRRLLDGQLVDYEKKETHVPYTRDVLPFLRTLMSLSGIDDEFQEERGYHEGIDGCDYPGNTIRRAENHSQEHHDHSLPVLESPHIIRSEGNINAFSLMEGRPMNSVFGDPCPGSTKLLTVVYLFRDYFHDDTELQAATDECDVTNIDNRTRENHDEVGANGEINLQKRGRRSEHCYYCTTSRIFQSTFREHEKVLLKRQDPLFRLVTDGLGTSSNIADDHHQANDKKIGTKSLGTPGDVMQIEGAPEMLPTSSYTTSESSPSSLTHIQSQSQSLNASAHACSSTSPSKQWKLAPTTSEITLPIILTFLTVRQRAKCQLVCNSWRDIVLEKGIATVIDVNDVGLFPKDQMDFGPTMSTRTHIPQSASRASLHWVNISTRNSSATASQSRPVLRGLLNHSHSSLEALVLNDFLPLQPAIDLHPVLPYLRKLQRLDISRIPSINDDTLHLISTCIGERLEVLYMKGLRNVTNSGIVELVQSCNNIRVLDVSQVHQLDDEAGTAISQLKDLEVFHGKDNYKLTTKSIDLIMKNCKNLAQVTFWGCIRYEVGSPLQNTDDMSTPPKKLVLLNLWGCHKLTDVAASRMGTLTHLCSLCVSECHRLTDQFVLEITRSLPHLLHLQLRYLRRITDVSLQSISQRMLGLYSLDLSFCTKLTIGGLANLLIDRCTSLSELRLYSCRQLDVEGGPAISGGRQLFQALRSVGKLSILSFLDLRECQRHEPVDRDDVYLNGLAELGFDEPLHGLFVRPAHWNLEVERQLAANLSDG